MPRHIDDMLWNVSERRQCRGCGEMFVPSASNIKRTDWICRPCQREVSTRYYAARKLAGMVADISLPLPETTIARFWAKVTTGPGCWGWTAYKDPSGYGRMTIKHHPFRAPRISWLIHNGAVPDGLWILHTCDNRECTNPAHLYLGTVRDNTRDMIERGRRYPTPGAKLTEAQVREILNDPRRRGLIAKDYGLRPDQIWKIKTRRSWGHLNLSQGEA